MHRSEQHGDEGHFSTSEVNIHFQLGHEGCIQYVEIHCGKGTGCGKVGPSTLGFGSFAETRLPSSTVSKKSLLKWPSVIF